MTLEGGFASVFDELRIGLGVFRTAVVEGSWCGSGGAERTEARFEMAGFGHGAGIRVDAVWRGSIVVRASSRSGASRR